MLVQSGCNRNHYQAEVNCSSPNLQSNFAALPPRSSGEQEVWKIGSTINNSSNQSGLNHSSNITPPRAENDSFNNNNNNNRSTYNDSSPDLSGRNVVKNSSSNDNECSSVILNELDLVASVNISLTNLKKGTNFLDFGSSSSAGPTLGLGSFSSVPTTATSITTASVEPLSSLGGSSLSSPVVLETPVNFLDNPSVPSLEIMSDAYLSGVKPETLKNNNHNLRQGPLSAPNTPETMRKHQMLLRRDLPMLSHSMIVPHVSAKKEKMEFNQMMMKMNERDRPLSYHGRSSESNPSPCILTPPVNKRHVGSSSSAARSRKEATLFNRRSMPNPYLENRFREKFDVSALDTNLPRIDLEAIENHLRLAREEERKRRSDREEIRRRLALESEDVNEKPSGRKPSLHSRLQSSMNLQICFMNETASDSESPNSDSEAKHQQQPASLPHVKAQSGNANDSSGGSSGGAPSEDFYARQARLQAEARQALSQAKEMARLQMAQEKEQRLTSPITDMVKNSLLKVGVSLPPERRRVSRQLLTEMNVAQLQVIVNDLHTHIEVLNETLVSMLLERDDLHMEQDSMLVDIEDLTRYLAAKDNSPHQSLPLIAPSRSLLGKK